MLKSFRVVNMLAVVIALLAGCTHSPKANEKVGQKLPRQGDEIVVCGQYFHTGGAKVILWTDPGGYDAYRTERRFTPWERASFEATAAEAAQNERENKPGTTVHSPNRYSTRFGPDRTRDPGDGLLTPEQFEQVRGGGWPLELLQKKVDQFVYHYDVAGVSRNCFKTLQDDRGLSVEFMLDVDGTIYQTLDVKECAWQATKANSRSVGIEIANIGAYAPDDPKKTLDNWYHKDNTGQVRMTFPGNMMRAWIRTPGFVTRPARNERITGEIQGRQYQQYDLTPQQYDALIKLTATLCTVFPKMTPDYPRDANGKLVNHVLPNDQYDAYQGLLGHYHVQRDKQDPGPAFQWDKVTNGARALMGKKPVPAGDFINEPKQSMAKK